MYEFFSWFLHCTSCSTALTNHGHCRTHSLQASCSVLNTVDDAPHYMQLSLALSRKMMAALNGVAGW